MNESELKLQLKSAGICCQIKGGKRKFVVETTTEVKSSLEISTLLNVSLDTVETLLSVMDVNDPKAPKKAEAAAKKEADAAKRAERELAKLSKELEKVKKVAARAAFSATIPSQIAMDEKIGKIYYFGGMYLCESSNAFGQAQWTPYSTDPLKRLLVLSGLSNEKFGNPLSTVEEALLHAEQKAVIDDFRDLAGYTAGLRKINSRTVVVTSETKVVIPEEGSFEMTDLLFERMFGSAQKLEIYHWLKVAYCSLIDEESYRRGQALFLVGPKSSCKNLFQDLITKLLGERSCDPSRFFCKETDFNSELFSSTHLKIDDMPPREDRNKFTAGLKNWVASTDAKCHQKGMPPQIYTPHNRVTVSLNDDTFSIQALPIMVNSIEDKVSLFSVSKPDLSDKIDISIIRNHKVLMQLFYDELPALAYYLLNKHVIPEDKIDNRFGVRSYHNLELLKKIEPNSKMTLLFEYIDIFFEKSKTSYIETTSAELHMTLLDRLPGYRMDVRELRYLLRDACEHDRYSSRIEKSKNSTQDKTCWIIKKIDVSLPDDNKWEISAGGIKTEVLS